VIAETWRGPTRQPADPTSSRTPLAHERELANDFRADGSKVVEVVVDRAQYSDTVYD